MAGELDFAHVLSFIFIEKKKKRDILCLHVIFYTSEYFFVRLFKVYDHTFSADTKILHAAVLSNLVASQIPTQGVF